MRVTLAGLVLAACSLAGCFTYAPSRPDAVSPGDDVRVTVEAERAGRLEGLFGDNPAEAAPRRLDGTVVTRDGDRLLISVPVPVGRRPGRGGVVRQRVDIAADQITRLDVREIDWLRTGPALGLGAAAVAVVIVRTFSDLVGGPRSIDRPPRRPQLGPLPR